ncbi:hypothetical protein ILUMI_00576 [Ignelater luminosus]|uniref:Cathepsin L1-like n=1 Tax=Ignelater luminosus TaxID=2038154 RepID=A0A8K0DK46_IGNLU|nr:hypothetical protein ILUMI_00576 [Ignelater luminosus]
MNLILVYFTILAFIPIITGQIKHLPNKNQLEELWKQFKERFNKTYSTIHEDRKKLAWEENLHRIIKHNQDADKGMYSFYIHENHLSDMNTRTYLQKMTKLTQSQRRKLEDPEVVGDFYERYHQLPEEVDWREKGFETPIYNQKDCGSCYAFSVALALQAQVYKQTGKLVPLSEQQLVDCSVSTGNFGCGGGSLRNTLKYLDKSGGLMAYSDYPYTAKQKRCNFDKNRAMVNLSTWAILPARNERAMEIAVAKIGPIAASINASPYTFQHYHSGVYDDIFCSSHTVNHAMLIVGYTKDAWILKNWWGKHWGENGYMRLKRNVNRCGIGNYVAYALV